MDSKERLREHRRRRHERKPRPKPTPSAPDTACLLCGQWPSFICVFVPKKFVAPRTVGVAVYTLCADCAQDPDAMGRAGELLIAGMTSPQRN